MKKLARDRDRWEERGRERGEGGRENSETNKGKGERKPCYYKVNNQVSWRREDWGGEKV